MPRTTIRTVLAAVVLTLALGACDMTVRIGTALEADGSGRFTLGVAMDREMRDGLEQSENDGLSELRDLFEGLQAKGWALTTSQPDGGIAWEATRAFANEAEFDEVINELGSSQDGTTAQVSGVKLEIDQSVEQSFLRTNARFGGVIDTSFGEAMSEQTRAIMESLGEVVRFEVKAELPGAVTTQEGDGTIRDGSVVWRPRLGTELKFSAEASALNTGALMMVLVPVLGLLAGGGWFLVGRRRGSVPAIPGTQADVPEEIVAEPVGNGFLAIKPLESIDLAEPQPERVDANGAQPERRIDVTAERDPDPV